MKNKSFTLIELLVVIAIIGLLSSIVLVSLKGTIGKAKIAKGLEFSQSIQHALGSEAVGIWSFDDCPAGTANDASGYGNNGTIYGASCTDDTPHKIVGSGQGKYALSFDGVNDYVDCGNDASLKSGESGTIEFWIKQTGTGTGQEGKIYLSNNRPLIYGINAIGVYWSGASKPYPGQFGLTLNQWTHAAISWTGAGTSNGHLYWYKNGVLVWNVAENMLPVGTIAKCEIATYYSANYFNGLIDEVRIYSEALSTVEIQKHYAKGAKRHGLVFNE